VLRMTGGVEAGSATPLISANTFSESSLPFSLPIYNRY
jgi:hypothetical protein